MPQSPATLMVGDRDPSGLNLGWRSGGTLTSLWTLLRVVNRSPLVAGLAAVFAGLTTLLLAAGTATGSVFVVFLALPLGITAGIMWLHGTGRLDVRTRRTPGSRTATGGFQGSRRERSARRGPFADGRGPFTGSGRFAGQQRQATGRRRRTTAGGRRTRVAEGMSTSEAARVLGVEPGAGDAAVKRAYREQAKRHHPDVEGGDETTFKRITEAYERLS